MSSTSISLSFIHSFLTTLLLSFPSFFYYYLNFFFFFFPLPVCAVCPGWNGWNRWMDGWMDGLFLDFPGLSFRCYCNARSSLSPSLPSLFPCPLSLCPLSLFPVPLPPPLPTPCPGSRVYICSRYLHPPPPRKTV